MDAGAQPGRRAAVGSTQLLFALAVAGPPLALGGVHPPVVVAFLVVVSLSWVRICWGTPARSHLVVPAFVGLGLGATLCTLAQWLPWPDLRGLVAPRMDALVRGALAATGVEPRPGLTPVPADTGLEVARLFGLSILFVVAAQLRWRTCVVIVAAIGTAVALVGFAHEALGVERIYGLYAARDVDLASATALRGPFVNANHQSGLLLLGIFASAALAADQSRRGVGLADPRHVDRFLAAMGALAIQIPALVLSLSRAAILVAIVLSPIVATLAWSRAPDVDPIDAQRRVWPKIAVVVGIVALFAVVAGHGAWQELATLASPDASVVASEVARKFTAIGDAFGLVELSPILGIGRGAFVDLYPAVQPIPSHRLATHLECAPAAILIEWGPVCGAVLVAGVLAFWWTAWRGGEADERVGRRIALLGLLALGLQSLADFSLEFLGVAAPAVALAGGLATGPTWRWPKRRVFVVVAGSLGAAIALSIASAPHAAMARAHTDREVLALERSAAGDRVANDELATRPLDGRLHGLLARRAADAGDWATVAARSQVATELRPGNIDAWLLRGAAARELGDLDAADLAIARGLALLHDVPDRALIGWLLAHYRRPHELAQLTPGDHAAWRLLVDAFAEVSPVHADALAAARAEAHPRDPEPLRVRHAMAMRLRNPALALHHGRLLRQLAPHEAASHVAVSHALRTFTPPRLAEARTGLEGALADGDVEDPAGRGAIEEELVVVLLELGDAARALAVLEQLLGRPADRTARVFREDLVVRARALDRRRR